MVTKKSFILKGLGSKLIFSILLLAVPFLGVTAYFNFDSQKQQLINNVIHEADSFSDTIKQSTKYDMQKFDREGVHHTIESVGQQEGVEWIRIFDKEGMVMYSSDPDEISTMVDKKAEACYGCHAAEKALEKLPTPERYRIFPSREHGTRILAMINPIYNEPSCSQAACHAHPPAKKVLGVIDVALSLEKVDRQIRRNRNNMIWFGLASILGISLLVALFIQRFVDQPVRLLVSGFQRVAGGDLNQRVYIPSGDEMGVLARAFNRMAEDLKKADEEIKEWGRTLEHKVEEKAAELQNIQEHLIQTEKMASLGILGAGVAHEINNPLAIISMYAEMSLEEIEKINGLEEIRDNLQTIIRKSEIAGNIVRNLLQFSRQTTSEKKIIDLNVTIEKSLNIIRNQAEIQNVKIAADLAPDLRPIFADDAKLQQVWTNIILNALQAMPEGGTLTITTRNLAGNHTLEVSFTDTGVGISRENLGKIFDPFFTTKDTGKGTGLGLSVSYGIIQEHDGTISVESEPGKGTTFTFRIPVKQNP